LALLISRPHGRIQAFTHILAFLLSVGLATLAAAQEPLPLVENHHDPAPRAAFAPAAGGETPHRFWDKENLVLFAGVGAVRTLDYTSTQHFRARNREELLLSNPVADNEPMFIGVEAAGTAASIGAAYWLHRTGHHRLERWLSIVHIGVGASGDINNYSLGRLKSRPATVP
jgi:hypothetical protein